MAKRLICSVCGLLAPRLIKGKCRKCYVREYNQRPEIKQRTRKQQREAYQSRPDLRAHKLAYMKANAKRGVKEKKREKIEGAYNPLLSIQRSLIRRRRLEGLKRLAKSQESK